LEAFKMSTVTQHPKSYNGQLKNLRRKVAALPCGHHESLWLRGICIELVDILLLNAGDNEIQEELAAQNEASIKKVPDNVVMTSSTMVVDPRMAPVVMLEPGDGGPAMNPQIVRKPTPDVVLTDADEDTKAAVELGGLLNTLGAAPIEGPATFTAPNGGRVKMVKPGEDPVKAMEEIDSESPTVA
jgi:hypothetical protein